MVNVMTSTNGEVQHGTHEAETAHDAPASPRGQLDPSDLRRAAINSPVTCTSSSVALVAVVVTTTWQLDNAVVINAAEMTSPFLARGIVW